MILNSRFALGCVTDLDYLVLIITVVLIRISLFMSFVTLQTSGLCGRLISAILLFFVLFDLWNCRIVLKRLRFTEWLLVNLV